VLISSLVAAVIAVVAVLVLRKFDRDNNQMDKVKRYADKRLADFDEYFKMRGQALDGLSADLETRQAGAVAAVHRLEKQVEEFKKISSGFDDRFRAVDEIGAKINAYGRSLGELMEMTEKVEQNLENVKKESVIIDKLNAKIEEEKKAVELINKRIPLIIQDFNGKNQDNLKAIATELLNQYKTRAEQIDAATKEAEQRSEVLMNKIDESIRQAYAEAATKATTLEDSAFTKLKENARIRSETFVREIKERAADLENQLNQKIAENQKIIDAKTVDFTSGINEKSMLMENEFRSKSEEMSAVLKREIGELDKSLKEQVNALDVQSREQTAEVKILLTDNLAQAKKLAAELQNENNGNGKALESIRESLAKQTTELQTRYTGLFEKAVQDADTKESNAYARFQEISDKHLDNFKSTIEAKINGMQQQMNATITEVQKKLADSENGATATAENIARKAEDANNQLQSFQTQADQKMAVINEKLGGMMTKLSQVYDAKQTELLGNVDKQLEEYRKNMEYRFEKLERIAQDVDTLEKNLRGQLSMTQKKVVEEFNLFSATQQQKQTQFENAIKTDSQDLATQIQILEKNLDEIKERASDNVSATLKDFEETFGADLKRRSVAIDDNLNTWKANYDSKLDVLTSDYEASRREMEVRYSEEMKQKLADIEERTSDQASRFRENIERSQNEIQNQITEVEQSIRQFTEKARADLQNATSTSDGFIKQALDGYAQRINEQMDKAAQDSQAKIDAMGAELINRNESNAANIDAMVSDFNAWRTQLKQQFEQTKSLYGSQLGSIQQNFEQNFEDFKNKTLTEQDDITKQISDLKSQVESSVTGYQERSEKILAEQQRMYEEMLQETQRRVREQNADADNNIREIKAQIQEINDQNNAREAEMVMRMQNDATDLQTRFSEIDRQVKSFSAQMQSYQKAEQLKNQIDSQIAELKGQLTQIETYQAAMDDLDRHFQSIQEINSDINAKLTKFSTEKNHIDSLERDFDRLVEMSGTMDSKIRELQTTNDDLQSLQLTVRNFQETLGGISDRYERLEKKQQVIDQVSASVDKTFEDLKDLEQRLEQASRQSSILPDRISDVQKNVENLMSSNSRINDAVDKVTSLQGLLDDTEKRVRDLQQSREGIARSETRLNELSAEIDSKFQLLAKLTKEDLSKNPGPVESRLSPQDRESIHHLKRQGWSVEEIARSMKRSVSEIELVLEMPE